MISIIAMVLTCTGTCWNPCSPYVYSNASFTLALGLYINQLGWEPIVYGGHRRDGVGPFVFGIPIAVGALSSLCLLVITVWPLFVLRSRLSLQWLWKCNTKDVFIHTIAQLKQPRELRMLGHPRILPISLTYVPSSTASSFRRWISPVFFRRVRSVFQHKA